MAKNSMLQVIESGVWLYLSMLANYIGGFVFWILASLILSADEMGLVSASVGLGVLLASIVSLGVGTGLQRLIGESLGRNRPEDITGYSVASLLLVGSVSIIMAISGVFFLEYAGFSHDMVVIGILLMAISALSQVYWGCLLGLLKSKEIFLYTFAGQSLRSLFVLMAWLIGFLSWQLAGLSYLAQPAALILAGATSGCIGTMKIKELKNKIIKILKVSLPAWLPNTILIAGQWIGVVVVYAKSGTENTGLYYVGYVLFTAVAGLGISITNMLLPVLSSNSKRGENLVVDSLRLSLAAISPISYALAIAPSYILALLGSHYVEASNIVRILIFSIPALIPFQAIYSYIYAKGRLDQVIALGLAQNVPRLILYLLLVSRMGPIGAAISFTIGSYVGIVAGLLLYKSSRLNLVKNILYPTLPPIVIVFTLLYINIPLIVKALLVASLTYPIYLLFGIIKWKELRRSITLIRNML